MKNAVKRNCAVAPENVLVPVHDSLGKIAEAAADFQTIVKEELNKKLQGIDFPGGQWDDLPVMHTKI